MRFASLVLILCASGCWDAHEPRCGVGLICTVAGSGEQGHAGDGGRALDATLSLPVDVASAPDGRVIVVDWNNHAIRAIDDEGTIRGLVGSGELGDPSEGPASTAAFNHPSDVAFDDRGRMLVAAWMSSRLVRVDLGADHLEIIAGTGARNYGGEGGPATEAAFDRIAAVVPVGDELVVTDQSNHVIRRIDADGLVHLVAGGPRMPGFADGPATDARFELPYGAATPPGGKIARGPDGSIYVADTINRRVRRIDPDGVVSTVAGTGVQGSAGDGGPAVEAELEGPADLAVAADGTIYVADAPASCVRAIGSDGIITTVAGTCGTRGFAGDGGDATSALLDRPFGVGLDGRGHLYIADTLNNRVRMVTLAP